MRGAAPVAAYVAVEARRQRARRAAALLQWMKEEERAAREGAAGDGGGGGVTETEDKGRGHAGGGGGGRNAEWGERMRGRGRSVGRSALVWEEAALLDAAGAAIGRGVPLHFALADLRRLGLVAEFFFPPPAGGGRRSGSALLQAAFLQASEGAMAVKRARAVSSQPPRNGVAATGAERAGSGQGRAGGATMARLQLAPDGEARLDAYWARLLRAQGKQGQQQ